VLVAEDDTILAGHARVMAAQQLKLDEVPVMVARGWTEAQRRAYVIADNQLALQAGWDEDMLRIELGDIEASGFDLDLIGFEADELAGLMDGLDSDGDSDATDAGADTEPEVDRAEELREKWGVETGQLWQLGAHRMLCGDSTKADDVARLLGDEKPHLMVTDPPYGVEYDADWRNHSFRADGSAIGGRAIGKVENDNRADWREVWALFPGDVAYVWHAGNKAHIVAESLFAAGFEIRAQIIWAKSNLVISRGHYHPKHEPCWYAVRKGKTGHWAGDRSQTTLWEIAKPAKSETGHSTQKPLECMAIPIQNNSVTGDLVYEPFSGSGTTLITCENLHRQCRAIEVSPAYVAVALERWHQHTGQQPELLVSDGDWPCCATASTLSRAFF